MPDVLYEKNLEEHYAVFTFNRPERLNALGGNLVKDLNDALMDFNNDVEMRVGIVTGSGRAFSAGADLKEMSDRNTVSSEIQAKFDSGAIDSQERTRQLDALFLFRLRLR